MVEGTFPIFNYWARVLYDSKASHSFISRSFAFTLGLEFQFMQVLMRVGSPLGRIEQLIEFVDAQ